MRQIPKTEQERERFKKLVQQAPLGGGHLAWKSNALWIEEALVIDPAKALHDFNVQKRAYDAAQDRSAYSHVFLAAGYGIRAIAPELEFRFSRGQLSWAKPIWDVPTAYGGYALNLDGAALVGATHDRLDDRDPFELRSEDDRKNLSALAGISGLDIKLVARDSRASVRVTSQDTLPILANMSEDAEDNIWALSGLGSRGFTFAPLLAEVLIAQLCREVGPLEKTLREKFSASSRYR